MDQLLNLIQFFKSILNVNTNGDKSEIDIINKIEISLKKEKKERNELQYLRFSELQYIIYNKEMLKEQNKLGSYIQNLENIFNVSNLDVIPGTSNGYNKTFDDTKQRIDLYNIQKEINDTDDEVKANEVKANELKANEVKNENENVDNNDREKMVDDIVNALPELLYEKKKISINNIVYKSLKDACDNTSTNKSTILWRLKSKNAKFNDYKYVD